MSPSPPVFPVFCTFHSPFLCHQSNSFVALAYVRCCFGMQVCIFCETFWYNFWRGTAILQSSSLGLYWVQHRCRLCIIQSVTEMSGSSVVRWLWSIILCLYAVHTRLHSHCLFSAVVWRLISSAAVFVDCIVVPAKWHSSLTIYRPSLSHLVPVHMAGRRLVPSCDVKWALNTLLVRVKCNHKSFGLMSECQVSRVWRPTRSLRIRVFPGSR